MRNGSTLLGTLTPREGRIGAGGWTTGMKVANDGTLIVRTDTENAYVLAPGAAKWEIQLKFGINCSAPDLFYTGDASAANPWGQPGTYDVAIAPSNSAVRYIVCMGYIWVTQNAGTSYTKSSLAQQGKCYPNEADRMAGSPLAVDPINPAVCWFSGPNGTFYTSDYGVSWTAVSTGTLPAPSAGHRSSVAFDPSSAVVSSKTQGIYIHIYGTGLRKSTNAGAAWTTPTQPSIAPTQASHLKIGSNGYVYLTGLGNADGQFRRWNGTSWLQPAGKVTKTIVLSHVNAGYIYSFGAGGGMDLSTDYGATWLLGGDSGITFIRNNTNIGWFSYTDENYMSNGDCVDDPTANRMWIAEGIGVWKCDTPRTSFTFGDTQTIVEYSNGIENMVCREVVCAPDGTVGVATDDRGGFILSNPGVTYPSKHGADNGFQHSQGIDYAPEDNAFWACTSFLGGRGSAYTLDRGDNWTRVDALPTASGGAGGGQIAVLSKDVWLQVQTNADQSTWSSAKNGVYLTLNRGTSWTLLTIGDNTRIMGQASYGLHRRVLIKDRYTAGRAYFYNVGDGTTSACRGIYRIDVNLGTGVPTITQVKSNFITTYGSDYYYGHFTQGSSASEWYYCAGDQSLGLWRSTDGMVSWAEVTGSDDQGAGAKFGEVFGVGVGKALYNLSYKTLLVAGWRNSGVTASSATGYGFWLSTDNGVTWKLVSQFLNGIPDLVTDIAGDPNHYGTFYVGYGGTGLWMQTYVYSLRAS